MCRMYPCLTAAGFLAGLAFLFLVSGLVVPLWRYTPASSSNDSTKSFNGLWFSVTCQDKNPCEVITFDKATVHDHAGIVAVSLWIVRAILLAGTGLALLGTLIVDCCCCARERSKGCHIFACILLWLSGLITGGFVLWLASGFSVLAIYPTAASFPWSYLFCGLGALFALIAALCLSVALCKWRQYDEYFDDRYAMDDGHIRLEQRQGGDKQGHANMDYQHSERPQREGTVDNTSKKSTNQEYNSYDKQHYDRLAQPPPYTQSQYGGGTNMYRPYSQNQTQRF